MKEYKPLRDLPLGGGFGRGDVLVLFGELFGRGYATGIVEEAQAAGMTVIGATVGRRAADGTLRPLDANELQEAEANLKGKIVNVPLEAGFDMEGGEAGIAPVDQLKKIRPDDLEEARLDWSAIASSREAGRKRFRANVRLFAAELKKLIPEGSGVLFVHTMAGGIPRARVYMPLLNRVFKGTGEKYLSSEVFWGSDLGRLCRESFVDVTAETFRVLIEETAELRAGVEVAGKPVSYAAYGYHGCEVVIGGDYRWQTYTPYLQGEAKMLLEDISVEAWEQGVRTTVYNAPEIQTNSSALFLGVENSLYPLLTALMKEGGGPAAAKIWADCRLLLKEGEKVETLLEKADAYLASPVMVPFYPFEGWPLHSTREQMEVMLAASAELMGMSADPRNPICSELSRQVFRSVGRLMFDHSSRPSESVAWLNHDIVARRLVE